MIERTEHTHTALSRMLLVTVVVVLLSYLCQRWYRSKYRHLASPGPSLPIIGHAYKMRTQEFKLPLPIKLSHNSSRWGS